MRRLLTKRNLFFVVCAVALVFAVTIPFTNLPFVVQNYTRVLIVALPAIGLSMLTGFGGVTSIGHSALFGIGAYTAAILVKDAGWEWYAAFPVAVVFATVGGLAISVPALRIKGLYLAIITMAIAAMFPSLILKLKDLTGGNLGKVLPRMPAPEWTGLASDQFGFFVALIVVIAAMVMAHNVAQGRSGLALVAMRDNETAAVAMGVDIARAKIGVFALSAAFTGAAGALFSVTQGVISSDTVYVTVGGSIEFLAALVVGGSTSILGPIIGAAIAERLPVMLSEADPVLAQVIYGAVLIIVVLVMRDGIAGAIGRLVDRILPSTPRTRTAQQTSTTEQPHSRGSSAQLARKEMA
ncbi:branched-chain amino acid ABC transporter permease [Microbacterium immunditiarum]|uniref:Branched-chain amino acid transport system permease protein n=1 Tax=Microbacterium immunditiarum TaxID=337480 RepID=A0A7Y9GRZ7_9MICO|nr:branched-chain amino acid ABC transporter permease [Microbacterium immunditiarum]NYE21541.1 branched-chain amino acid transport system permease protein [Microbacterium immunditiarum]